MSRQSGDRPNRGDLPMDRKSKASNPNRLGYLLEIICCFAFGFWTLTSYLKVWHKLGYEGAAGYPQIWMRSSQTVTNAVCFLRSFGVGFSLACGVGLAVEKIRDRTARRRWGWGRVTIAIVSLTILLTIVMLRLNDFMRLRDLDGKLFSAIGRRHGSDPTPETTKWVLNYFVEWLPLCLASTWISMSFSGGERPCRADTREWLGRSLGTIMLITCIVWHASNY